MKKSIAGIVPLCLLIAYSACAQYEQLYKDTTFAFVLKTRPLSWVNSYLMAGVEIPIGFNNHLDINFGVPVFGRSTEGFEPGGILARAGFKIPMFGSTPYSLFYFSPEMYVARFRRQVPPGCFQCPPDNELYWARAMIYGVDFGYRKVNPANGFYFDIGTGVGFGVVRVRDYDHIFGNGIVPVVARYTSQEGFRGYMMNAHIAIGKAFKRKRR